MLVKKALVIYKGKPALAEEKGDRLELTLEGGEKLKVRSRDVLFLHPGPSRLELRVPEGEEEAAWELLEGQKVSLKELAELAFGAYTPEAAYGAYLLAQKGERFVLEGGEVRARTREELASLEEMKRRKEERERAFGEAVERIRQGRPSLEDRPLLAEVEALAYGERKESRLLKALGLPETPEAAHGLLLRLGLWRRENPHPRRLGLPLAPPDLPVPPCPRRSGWTSPTSLPSPLTTRGARTRTTPFTPKGWRRASAFSSTWPMWPLWSGREAPWTRRPSAGGPTSICPRARCPCSPWR
jgi:exoribonuclease-2